MITHVFSLVSSASAGAVEKCVSVYQSFNEQEAREDMLSYLFLQCCLLSEVILIFCINSVLL